MRNFVINFIKKIYRIIFKEEISLNVQLFLKSLRHIVIGSGIAVFCNFIFQIFMGRILGPDEYGKYALINSIAMFLCVPMLFSIHIAMVKYVSEKADSQRQKEIISTSFIMIFILSLISILIFLLFSSQFSSFFSVSLVVFYIALLFALFFSFYTIAISIIRSFNKMKKWSIFQVVYGISTLTLSLFFIFFVKLISFHSAIFSILLTYLLIFILVIIYFRKSIVFRFSNIWAKKLAGYGLYGVIGGVSAAFYLNFDKIMINRYLTSMDVGIYKAYATSFTALGLFFLSMFLTVFFPTVSKYHSKKNIFKKINKFIPYLFIFGLPFMFFSGFVILKLYGNNYFFDLKMGLLFCIAGIFIILNSLYLWLMNAIGKQGVRITAFSGIILAVTNILLNIFLIPIFGISGAIIATIISYGVSIVIIFSKRKYYYLTVVN